MIEALYSYGKVVFGESRVLLDKPSCDYLLILDFDANGDCTNISSTKNISPFADKLLYKQIRASRRCNASAPTFYLNTKAPEKAIKCLKAIFNHLKKFASSPIPEPADYKKLLTELKAYLSKNPFGARDKVLLTLRFDGKFPAEVPQIHDAFFKAILSDAGFSPENTVNGICALCQEKKPVSGEKSPLAFYTLDKIGYLSGFSKKFHFRGFPLCYECYILLENAKKEVFAKRFEIARGAPRYIVIPNLVLSQSGLKNSPYDEETIKEIFSAFYDREEFKKVLKLTHLERKKLTDSDEEILDLVKELEDILTLHFLFIENQQARELIRLHIQDVYPSRIKELFEAKEWVEKSIEYKTPSREFTLGVLWKFFSKLDESSKATFAKEFLELLDRVFRKIPYSQALLIKVLLNGIRRAYFEELESSGQRLTFTTFDALACYLFIKMATEGTMGEIKKENLKDFLDSLPLLEKPEAKGLFLLGVLTQRLLEAQSKEREGRKPFLKKLCGFKLDERGFKKLLPELMDKLEAYEAFGFPEEKLFELLSEYFAMAGSPWKLNLEEMNFIFAIGMGMKKKIYKLMFGG